MPREGATTELSRMNKDLEVVDHARAFPKKQKLKWKRAKLTNTYLGYKNFYTEGQADLPYFDRTEPAVPIAIRSNIQNNIAKKLKKSIQVVQAKKVMQVKTETSQPPSKASELSCHSSEMPRQVIPEASDDDVLHRVVTLGKNSDLYTYTFNEPKSRNTKPHGTTQISSLNWSCADSPTNRLQPIDHMEQLGVIENFFANPVLPETDF